MQVLNESGALLADDAKVDNGISGEDETYRFLAGNTGMLYQCFGYSIWRGHGLYDGYIVSNRWQ